MTREEAINLIKQVLPCLNIDEKIREGFVTLIPELRESEDERIMKELLNYHKQQYEKNYDQEIGLFHKDAIAYLEKQKEPKLLNNEKYQTVPVEILNRLYASERELQEIKQKEQKPVNEPFDVERYDLTEFEKELVLLLRGARELNITDEEIIFNVKNQIAPELMESIKEEQKSAEWSEEDKAIVGCIAVCLDGQFVTEAARKQCLKWFNKHRRDFLNRPSWKPSEEQMNGFHTILYQPQYISNSDDERLKQAESLYNDLKKLM